jgi:periplasmic protein CpxP/Spy
MKRIARQFTYPTALAVAMAVLFALMILASPSPSPAAAPEPGVATAGTASKADRVEARIKELYAKLKITPAQEELWNKVTQVMRDDAKTMEGLIKTRSEKESTMTAVDDLKSYSAITEAHADYLKKFIPVFEPLYASMSDAQKKSADTLFRHHGHAKSKAKAKGK